MRRKIMVAVVLLVLSLAGSARALNEYEVWTHFYDCNLSMVGGTLRECDNGYWMWQQQYGAYKAVETWSCDGGTAGPYAWYAWDGSSWVELEGPPSGC
jgi:hypothetical protein